GAALCRAIVEVAGRALHSRRLAADLLDAQVLDQPDRTTREIARDMLAPEKRDRPVEAALIIVDQPPAMLVLLGGHLVEHRGGAGIAFAQPRRVGGVDAAVVLLVRDGEREDLALGKL